MHMYAKGGYVHLCVEKVDVGAQVRKKDYFTLDVSITRCMVHKGTMVLDWHGGINAPICHATHCCMCFKPSGLNWIERMSPQSTSNIFPHKHLVGFCNTSSKRRLIVQVQAIAISTSPKSQGSGFRVL